ncbi:MAG TPA: invasion associated locus B family protein [Dongiaceae bacterium]|nr:invasion associated locus B family protein [Dongiaceae bacterium]
MLATLLAGLALGGATLIGTAGAQTAATPPAFPTQTFKSWALDCLVPKAGPSAGKRVCFIHHEARPPTDPKHVAARAVIRHTGPDRKLVLIVELPPNTVQASGASAAIDTSPPVAIPLAGCIQQFCYGALELTPALQNAIKVGQQMTLGFTPKDYAKQSVAVPLAGVTAALAALEQTGS